MNLMAVVHPIITLLLLWLQKLNTLYLKGFQSNSITVCIKLKCKKGYPGTVSSKGKSTRVTKQNKIHHVVLEALQAVQWCWVLNVPMQVEGEHAGKAGGESDERGY